MAVSGNSSPNNNRGTLGVYIHWPFCASKCPYCDFNSHVAAPGPRVDQGRWRKALLSELAHFAAETQGRAVTSVFFGGGTPSLMDPDTAAALIEAVKSQWQTDPDLEVTLEANPSTAEAGRFRNFLDAGVNRLSIGVQSFDDGALRFLGRGHSADEARDAIAIAAETFPRFSFDLIYGLPGQSREDWERELDQALALAGDHLSLYQLAIEPGTPFHRDGVQATGDDLGAALYGTTQDRLEAAGLPAYEVSNHARPGFECRHNLDIWRGGDYVGSGPGAHGRLTGRLTGCLTEAGGTEATYQIHDPRRWLAAVETDGHATAKRQPLTPVGRAEEILMTGLRLPGGIERVRLAGLENFIDTGGLKRMIDGGFVETDGAGLRATAQGRLCLNEVLRQLLVS